MPMFRYIIDGITSEETNQYAISTYKQEALPKMKETINQFKELAEQGEKQILRLEQGNLNSDRLE